MPGGHAPAHRLDGPGRLREAAGALVLADLGDPPGVPGVTGEPGTEERLDQRRRLLQGVLPGADGYHVRVVVQPGQARGVGVPHERGADPDDLVRGDLLTVARATDH